MESTTIEATTLSNLYQLSLNKEQGIFGDIKYVVTATRDGKEASKQTFSDLDVARSIYLGFIEFYNTLA